MTNLGRLLFATTLSMGLLMTGAAVAAGPVNGGFTANTLPANDDGSTGSVALPFGANFFGTTYNSLFVNNNGNVTFGQSLSNFTPFSIAASQTPIIAPFFADVDTRKGNIVTFGSGLFKAHNAFVVNWPDVRHFDTSTVPNAGLPTNSQQGG